MLSTGQSYEVDTSDKAEYSTIEAWILSTGHSDEVDMCTEAEYSPIEE